MQLLNILVPHEQEWKWRWRNQSRNNCKNVIPLANKIRYSPFPSGMLTAIDIFQSWGPDLYVFEPPGSGPHPSVRWCTDPEREPDPSIIKQISIKKLWILLFCEFIMTFYLRKMYIQKVISRKNSFCWRLEGQDENSRIRTRIHWSAARIRGSVPKCHGSTTLHLLVH